MSRTSMHVRRTVAVLALALVPLLAVSAPASAAPAQGTVSIEAFTLSGDQFGTPTGFPTLARTEPLQFPAKKGDSFTYSSIECRRRAPFNNVGLDFTPNFPGLNDPAPIRSIVRGTVTERTGNRGTITGTITTILCVNGQEADTIVISYQVRYQKTRNHAIVLRGGTVTTTGGLAVNGSFVITSGTGRFNSLTGSGTLTGQLTCLPRTLERNDAQNCAQLGAYSEAIFQLQGTYRDPAPGPGTAS